MQLTTSSMTYKFTDPSGYEFHVDVVLDPEYGWAATVSMSARGYRTPGAAIEKLGTSAKEFLRQLEENLEDIKEVKS